MISTLFLLLNLLICINQCIIFALKKNKRNFYDFNFSNFYMSYDGIIYGLIIPIKEEYFYRFFFKAVLFDIINCVIIPNNNLLMYLTSFLFGFFHDRKQSHFDSPRRIWWFNQIIMMTFVGVICYSTNNLLYSIIFHGYYNLVNIYILKYLNKDKKKSKYDGTFCILRRTHSVNSFFDKSGYVEQSFTTKRYTGDLLDEIFKYKYISCDKYEKAGKKIPKIPERLHLYKEIYNILN